MGKGIKAPPEEDMKNMAASFFVMARMMKDKHDALLAGGFSEQEALELLKARGLDLPGRSGDK